MYIYLLRSSKRTFLLFEPVVCLFPFVISGLTCKDLDCLPFGVAVPVREALHQSAADPPLTLPTGAYQLIGEELERS